MAERRFGVGYALAPKKQKSFIRESLVSLARSRGVDLIEINDGAPLAEQGPFDVVLHKRYGDDWRRELQEFSARNPGAVVVDSPEAIERLHNRISMLQVVTELAAAEQSQAFGIPKQTVIYDSESLLEGPAREGLSFPVIAKPLVADGSAKSHKMTLVYGSARLGELKPPIVLQEFVNHGGVIFKVYVAGKYVRCAKRKSLPDVSDETGETEGGLLKFSQVSNLAKNERTDDKYYKKMRLDDTVMPPSELLDDIARGLRKAMGLNLFNFDVIRDTRFGEDRYLIIDINYFPGYAKMPGYEAVMTDFFCDLMESKLGAAAETTEKKLGGGGSCCGDGDEGALPVSPRSREEENSIQV